MTGQHSKVRVSAQNKTVITALSSPSCLSTNDRIVITGAAGLVGQNLVPLLWQHGYRQIVALDCHADNLAVLKQRVPGIETHQVDLSRDGSWTQRFAQAACVIQLQAQISARAEALFTHNTLHSTERVLAACRNHAVPYVLHLSSSVVKSRADDAYVRSKTAQEALVRQSGLNHAILRPTLLFGRFDRKHLGWLSRFMGKTPVFPIPGHGRYLRQPLFVNDVCRVMIWCLQQQPHHASYDLTGSEGIDYIDLIRAVRRHAGRHCLILPLPKALFGFLLRIYALFSRNPPFTADQMDALTVGDVFDGVDWPATFGFSQTPLDEALALSFGPETRQDVVLARDIIPALKDRAA